MAALPSYVKEMRVCVCPSIQFNQSVPIPSLSTVNTVVRSSDCGPLIPLGFDISLCVSFAKANSYLPVKQEDGAKRFVHKQRSRYSS